MVFHTCALQISKIQMQIFMVWAQILGLKMHGDGKPTWQQAYLLNFLKTSDIYERRKDVPYFHVQLLQIWGFVLDLPSPWTKICLVMSTTCNIFSGGRIHALSTWNQSFWNCVHTFLTQWLLMSGQLWLQPNLLILYILSGRIHV